MKVWRQANAAGRRPPASGAARTGAQVGATPGLSRPPSPPAGGRGGRPTAGCPARLATPTAPGGPAPRPAGRNAGRPAWPGWPATRTPRPVPPAGGATAPAGPERSLRQHGASERRASAGHGLRPPARPSAALRVYRTGSRVAGLLPGPVSRGLAEGLGVVAARMPPVPGPLGGMARRRRMAARHLRRVYGARLGRAICAGGSTRRSRPTVGTGRRPCSCRPCSRDQILAGISYEGFEHIAAGEAAGRGTILALPHLGGWEWAGTAAGADRASHLGGGGSAGATGRVRVVRRLPRAAGDAGDPHRSGCRRGLHQGPGGQPSAVPALRPGGRWRGRDRGGVLRREDRCCRPGRSPWRCGRAPPSCPAPCTSGRPPIEHVAVVRPPLALRREGRLRDDVQMWTQVLASELEVLIGRAPTQWHLMQPNWPSDRDGSPLPAPQAGDQPTGHRPAGTGRTRVFPGGDTPRRFGPLGTVPDAPGTREVASACAGRSRLPL